MENRDALLIEFAVEPGDGYAERKSARAMLETALPGSRRITLGADKGYDTREFVASCRAFNVTPHIARNARRAGGSVLDRRTVRHGGYAVSQRVRKRVEEIFGWMKTVGGLRKTRSRGLDRTQLHAYLVAAAYNLLRIARLAPALALTTGPHCSFTPRCAQKPHAHRAETSAALDHKAIKLSNHTPLSTARSNNRVQKLRPQGDKGLRWRTLQETPLL